MEETGLVFRPFVDPWLIGGAAMLVLVASILAYRRTTRPVSRAFRAWLLVLRTAALAAVTLCLLRPSLQTTHYETVKSPLVLLVDASRSMTEIRDTPTQVSRLEALNQFLQDNAAALDDLAGLYELIKLDFARGLLGPDEARSAADVGYSAYGTALQQAYTEAANSQCDAVVVMGDGAHNAGQPDPVDAAAGLNEQGVPVYTVGVGQDEATSELRDVKVLDVEAPRTAFLLGRFPVRAQVLFRGCQGMRVTARLDAPSHAPQETQVTVGHPEEIVPVEFQFEPELIGDHKLTVTVDPLPNELLKTNNSGSTFVKVVNEGLRVGFFDVLRPESKFIARSLQNAQHVVLRRELVLAGQSLSHERTQIDRYDVVMLGDLPYSALLPSRVIELKRAVQEDGKGLIVLLTTTSGGTKGWAGTPLVDLLPVTIDGSVDVAAGERPFAIEADRADHPILAVPPDAEATRAAWADVPALAGAVVNVTPKRGATVLARDQDGNPLLVVHRSGAGHVACLMADTTFRWFFTDQETQDHHRRFWRQLATWAGGLEERDAARIRLALSRQKLLVEEKLKVTVYLEDQDGQPIRDAQLALCVAAPGGEESPLSLAFSRREGAYLAEYSPAEPGDYRVTAEASRNGDPLGEDSSHFHASRTDLELEDPVADLKLLRRMSAASAETGGRYYYYAQANDLLRALRDRANPLKLTTRRRQDVWDSQVLFALFALCMGTEWALRKWKGLV